MPQLCRWRNYLETVDLIIVRSFQFRDVCFDSRKVIACGKLDLQHNVLSSTHQFNAEKQAQSNSHTLLHILFAHCIMKNQLVAL